jgi:coenzyme F420-reducing hydrogenase delta subunit
MQAHQRIIVFSCNWSAYSGMESAAVEGESFPAGIRPIRLACLGRLHPGHILKAFDHGAAGVLLLGCPPGECQHGFGYQRAEEVFELARKLIRLLGFRETRLQLGWVAADDGDGFVRKINRFADGLTMDRIES